MPREQSDLGTPAAKPHVCQRCRRSFRRSEHLQRHVRTHTNERPFTCTCGLAFTRRDLLRRHERLYHSKALPGEHGEEHMPSKAPSVVGDFCLTSDNRPHHQDEHAARGPPDGTDGIQQLSHVECAGFWTEPNQPSRPVNGRELTYRPIQTSEIGDEPSQQLEQGASQDLIILPNGGEIDMSLNFLYSESSQFHNFTEFADSMGLPFEWVSFDLHPPYNRVQNVGNNVQAEPSVLPNTNKGTEQRSGSPFQPWLPTVQLGSRIRDTVIRHDISAQGRFTMSAAGRAKMEGHLSAFQHAIPDFNLPSRHTLTRYFISFFEGFHTHLPFVHIPTIQIDNCYPEFLLAMATLGAQYRFEHQNADNLFWAAKAIVLERIRRRELKFSTGVNSARTTGNVGASPPYLARSPQYISPPTEFKTVEPDTFGQTEVIKTIFLLLGFASWDPRSEILQEAIGFQDLLVRCLRTAGLNTDNVVAPPSVTWHEWAERESDRRTKLLAYTFLNVHSIAYNTLPVLFSSELFMRLPCSTAEWNAEDVASWQTARRNNAVPQLKFQDALALLLKNGSPGAVLQPLLSPLGSYIILHGLFQRIYLVRELALPLTDSGGTLPSKELDRLETALQSWTTSWKLTPESSLDPRNKNGPIPFTSSSLLGLAYIRLHLHLGPHRLLETRSPPHIATAIFNAPTPQRHPRLVPALMYSVHALSIPVRLGVDYVARSQAQFWSVRHALASFECCILLTKWLCLLVDPQIPGNLSEGEALVLNWARRVVDEAWSSMDREDEQQSSSPSPVELGLAIVKIWARMFKRNVQWRFINIMGLSLDIYFKKVQAEALAGSAPEIEQVHSDCVVSL